MHTAQVNVGRSTLTIETGKLAKQADGAVTVRYGDTVVIVTACAARAPARESTSCRSLSITASTPTRPAGSRADSSSARENRPKRRC